MSLLRRPYVAYALFVLSLGAIGAVLLSCEAAMTIEARPDMRFYWALHGWECAFDSVSAATGCGLATHRWTDDLTSFGEFVVLIIGVLSTAGYLTALSCCLPRAGARGARGTTIAGIVAWIAVTGLIIALCMPPDQRVGAASTQASWTALLSLGSARVAEGGAAAVTAIFAAIGGCGWFALLFARRIAALGVTYKGVGGVLLSYGVIVVCFAALLFVYDGRRGADLERGVVRGGLQPGEPSGSPGFGASLRAIIAAQCGGTVITPSETAPHRDTSRFVLGSAVLLGGVFGAPGGGVLVPASLALALWLAGRRDATRAWLKITRQTLIFAVLATLIVALGLLLIEQKTASAFSAIPTFADAWLDAASAIGGANLTSDLAAAVTDRSLSSGIRTPSDQYQYGMLWLMAAMLVGRITPLWILGRAARVA
ncbi:MAG: hypothetical protein JNG88_06645 [Phycisphaerales bacterium]|nr:hypothetical protein [Phycisphaerales bacterium]